MLPDCSVCGEGYASTLAFRCSRCAGENVAVTVVVLAVVVCSALVFVWHMVSIEQEDATRGIIVRVKKVLPLQSIKIVVVAWQIVTQVSSSVTLKAVSRRKRWSRELDSTCLYCRFFGNGDNRPLVSVIFSRYVSKSRFSWTQCAQCS